MIDILKRHGVNLFWTFGIFIVAMLIYIITASFIPYPGISSEYFTALCYPGSAPKLLTSPVDTLCMRAIIATVAPNQLSVVMGLFYAMIGAGIVACLFRCAIATARHASVDLTGVRDNELDRVLFTISHISFETGIATALLAVLAMPIWAIATRPYPQSVLALLLAVMLTCALEFRWRTTQNYLLSQPPRVQHCIVLGVTYALIALISFMHPMLIPVTALAFVMASGIFLRTESEGRGPCAIAATIGLGVGLIAAIVFTAQWAQVLNVAQAPLPNAISLWGQHFAAGIKSLVPRFTVLEGLAPLTVFLSAAALFLGCFPHAYLKLGSPIIGQIASVGLFVVAMIRWPEPVWALFCEPDALTLIAGFMLVLCMGALLGSWLHAGFGEYTRWSRARFRTLAFTVTLVVTGALSIYIGVRNAPMASGLYVRDTMQEIAPLLDELVAEDATLWLTPRTDMLGIVARRYLAGKPVQPQAESFESVTSASLTSHAFLRVAAAKDPLIPALVKLGPEPLRQYLLVMAPELGIMTQLPPRLTSTNAAKAAKCLHESPFGKTVVGERCVTLLNQMAAREHAACAIGAEPEAAATHLRLARVLDPENKGIPLSLASLQYEGVTVTQQERNDARDVVEARPSLRAPSAAEALAFEYRYGPVRTQGFCSASRLRRLHLGNAPAVLKDIVEIYKETPALLSTTECLVAVLHMPIENLVALWETRTPSEAELQLFFCAYPDAPQTDALYEKYKKLFRTNDALNTLFREKNSRLRERVADKMQSFFLRDGEFAYALYYVNALLADKDLATAVKFVGGFNVRERLAKTPALVEELRCRVLKLLLAEDPAQARVVCEGWLRSEPRQYRIWSMLLSDEMPKSADPEAELRACLRQYPLHPIATARYAEILEKDLGLEAAKRYRDSVNKATEEGSCLQKDTHAHRRF